MKILTFTTLFPNNIYPNHAIFVNERIKHMKKEMDIRVIAPVPYFPPINISKKWYSYSQVTPFERTENGTQVHHPRYYTIPKFFMSLYGHFLYYCSISYLMTTKRFYDFQLIDAHYAYPDGYAAVRLGKYFKVPVTVTVRGTDINLFPSFPRIKKRIIYTLTHATKIISVSQALKDKIVELGIPESKVEVIRNGVDATNFHSISEKKNILNNTFYPPTNKKIILSVGNIIETKGFQILIKALRKIKSDSLREVPFLIIVGDGPYRKTLEELIATLNLENDVYFTGSISHSEMVDWYNLCDLFCLASYREGIPNVILEAFACGKPVVASSVGGIPEIITDDCGLLAHKLSADIFTEKITYALDKEWDHNKIISHSRTFNWDNTTKKISTLFKSIIHKGK